jgi:hypothetical protein
MTANWFVRWCMWVCRIFKLIDFVAYAAIQEFIEYGGDCKS